MSTSNPEGCLYDPDRVSLPPCFYPDNPTETTSAFSYALTFQALACLQATEATLSELWPITIKPNLEIKNLLVAEICILNCNFSRNQGYPQKIDLMTKFLTAMNQYLPGYNELLIDDIPAQSTLFARLGSWFSQNNLPFIARTKLHMVNDQGIFVHKGLVGRLNGKNYGYSTEAHNWRQVF